MSVGVKLWQPVIILGLGKSQLGSTSIGQSSETDKVLERKPAGPYRATQVWKGIIAHLRKNVDVRPRRIKKAYELCFSGTHAVNVVLDHLLSEKDNFTDKRISRVTAVKLCQLMQNYHVFEPAKGAEEGKGQFDDSATKFYKFLDEKRDTEDTSSSSSSKLSDMSTEAPTPPAVVTRHGQMMQELMDITGSLKRYSSDCLKRKLTPRKFFAKRPSLPDISHEVSCPVSLVVEEEIWREVALRQLLTLVDIPVLDGILSCEVSLPKVAKQDLAYSNLAFRRFESISSLFPSKDDDPWLSSASNCLECCSVGADLLDVSGGVDTGQRLLIFQCLAQHYGGLSEPLWTDTFTDLHVALLQLLMSGREYLVIEALQLSMLLLPSVTREELTRLLRFMHLASAPDAVSLNTTDSNRNLMEKTFTNAIIQNKVLAPHQAGQLVLFMMDHADELLMCPDAVEEMVLMRLDDLRAPQVPCKKPEPTFCTRVTEDEFKKQQIEETEGALVSLMNAILDDHKMALKEKKNRLKQFQKHHNELYKKNFADIL
ncbi:hypothetical protein NP493_225g03035 [Ridgeia piscesae]|uniref:DEP domain-containing protein n=1 Tax=Ridgeia piscesae TaxID=27915 RepID=A0AAD9UDT0_RIDPI|nr:hypothetical protein NP493_225g03035 [Ridgeia piscesae]